MLTPDLRTREARAAQAYMKRKGYPDTRPYGVIAVEEQPCWYFYYSLPEGRLELEVSEDRGNWQWAVAAFRIWDETDQPPKSELLAG